MTKDLQNLTRLPLTKEIRLPAVQNPAVAHCCDAYAASYYENLESGASDPTAKARARNAYRLVMPALTGSNNIRDFIACVSHGMVLGAIDPAKASKLLYAAQVAHAARQTKRKSIRARSRAKKSASKRDSSQDKAFSKPSPDA